eukprot:2294693-Pleurochrysis_carterae.AAC.1
MANIAKSSASAVVAESPSLPLRTPRSTALSLSVWFNLMPSLCCNAVAFPPFSLSISTDSGPIQAP